MGFHNVVLPAKFLGRGSVTGPGHRTYTGEEEADSGVASVRESRYAQARREYRIVQEDLPAADAAELWAFVRARGGSANSFLIRDPLDFSTNPNNPQGAPTATDIPLWTNGVIQGTQPYIEYFKHYGGARGLRYLRRIERGTLLLNKNGAPLIEGTDFFVDYFLGRAYEPAGVLNDTYTGGCKFYVKVRFGKEVDEAFRLTARSFVNWSADLPMVEDNAERHSAARDTDRSHPRDEMTTTGGGIEYLTTGQQTQDYNVQWLDGRMVNLNPANEIRAVLPIPPPTIATGGPYFCISNRSNAAANVVLAEDITGSVRNLLSRPLVRPGNTRECWLDQNRIWRAV